MANGTALIIGDHLACTADPRLFGSTDVVDHKAAKARCRVCPVAFECGDDVDRVSASHPQLLVGTFAGRRFAGVA